MVEQTSSTCFVNVQFIYLFNQIPNYIKLHKTIQWIWGQSKTEYEIPWNKLKKPTKLESLRETLGSQNSFRIGTFEKRAPVP